MIPTVFTNGRGVDKLFETIIELYEGIMLPKSVTKGKIVKTVLSEGAKRYDFQFVNKRGYQDC